MEVPSILVSMACEKQFQTDGILKESQPTTKVCTIDIVEDDPIVGNNPNTIGTMLFILGSGIHSACNTSKHSHCFLNNQK
jgi:hypothetical protein